jgi:DNA-binding transcriptional regulator YiaG
MGSKSSTKVPARGTKKVPNLSKVTPSPRQIRAARAAVDMSAQHLAELAGVTKNTVLRYERGTARPLVDTLQALRTVLEDAGIEFIDRGVRWRADE